MMRKFLFGLWLFAMGATVSLAGHAAVNAIIGEADLALGYLLVATLVSVFGMLPMIGVIHSYRRDINAATSLSRGAGCRSRSPSDSDGVDPGPDRAGGTLPRHGSVA